ncbi:hypothetical protein D3C86_1706270 [compost metagenome]
MVAVAATARVGSVKDGVVEPIHGGVNDTNEVVFWNIFFQIHWQAKLVHGILNVQRNRSFEMVVW